MITSENRKAWQAIADNASAQRPSVGKSVKVVKGRKHKGAAGIVVWHGINQFASTAYKSDAMMQLREINGREGYRVKIKTDSGETFYVNAEYVEVI